MDLALDRQRTTVIVGAGHSQALGLPGTSELTEIVDHTLSTTTHWPDVSKLRSNLVAYFNDRYSFEILAAALEACEIIGRPKTLLGTNEVLNYDTVLPLVSSLRSHLGTLSALDVYGLLIDAVRRALSVDWRNALRSQKLDLATSFYSLLSDTYQLDIFSLNYDSTLEALLPNYKDGFDDKGDFDSSGFLTNDGLNRLAHLHGCVDWSVQGASVRRIPAQGSSSVWTVRSDGVFCSAITTGEAKPNKLTFPPYNLFHAYLAQCLLVSPRLIIVGYGGRDTYLNAWIHTAARHHGAAFRAVLLDRFPHRYGPPFATAAVACFAEGSTDVNTGILCDWAYGYQGQTVWLNGVGFPPDTWLAPALIRFLGGNRGRPCLHVGNEANDSDKDAFKRLVARHAPLIANSLVFRGSADFSYASDYWPYETAPRESGVAVEIRPVHSKAAFAVTLVLRTGGRIESSRRFLVSHSDALEIIQDNVSLTAADNLDALYNAACSSGEE